ncbi:30S ribosomal protein S20 [Candidatus Gottesmanbacteria bacterium]|nr:30S ribosomal protein S20 [Candidatus Gottesmanbacteria bacterium]
MPIIRRAIKKLRHDRNRTLANAIVRKNVKQLVHAMRKKPTAKALATAYKALDKAAKHHVIPKNRAARTKSRLAKLLY